MALSTFFAAEIWAWFSRILQAITLIKLKRHKVAALA